MSVHAFLLARLTQIGETNPFLTLAAAGALLPGEQRATMIGLLNVLARIQVTAVLPNPRRKNRIYRMNSAIVNLLSDTIGEYTLDTGEIVWQRRKVALGNWAAVAPQLSSQTVDMLRRILSYHPQKDRFSKRLGRFLTLQFSTATAVLELPMSQLIVRAGVPVDRTHPDRTRRAIESAFAELIQDQIDGIAGLPFGVLVDRQRHDPLAQHPDCVFRKFVANKDGLCQRRF